jgi:cell division protein FtsB
METPEQKIAKQEKEIQQLKASIQRLEKAVSLLERENNRRKQDITQIANVLKRG